MSKKLFDVLRILQIVFPAIGVLYEAIAAAWGLPYAEPVMVTAGALAAFIGTILKIDSAAFFSGKEIVEVPADVDSKTD